MEMNNDDSACLLRRGRNYTKIRKMGKVCCLATTTHTTTRNCCVKIGSVLPKNFVDVIGSLFHSLCDLLFSFRSRLAPCQNFW
jgi:hypothetical protein